MNTSKIICLLLCVVMINSCALFKSKKKESTEPLTVEELYNEALTKLEKGRYEGAVEKFEELERVFPYSKWAIKSQIMSAYANYKNEDYDSALVTLERFTKLHPGNEDIPYAYYLRALSFYEQISNVTRDQSYSAYAKSALQEVVARFPNSKYAKDANLKIDLVNDHLAGKEVDVGRFYMNKGRYIAAINRFQKVLDNYDTTAHVPEALHRLVESYVSLGIRDEATRYAAVLGYNFPSSKWYKRSYKLLEDKDLSEQTDEEKKGKWYDFTVWKGLKLKEISFYKGEDNSKELLEDIDVNIDNKAKEANEEEIEKPAPNQKEADKQSTGKKNRTVKKILNWFRNLKMPFSKD